MSLFEIPEERRPMLEEAAQRREGWHTNTARTSPWIKEPHLLGVIAEAGVMTLLGLPFPEIDDLVIPSPEGDKGIDLVSPAAAAYGIRPFTIQVKASRHKRPHLLFAKDARRNMGESGGATFVADRCVLCSVEGWKGFVVGWTTREEWDRRSKPRDFGRGAQPSMAPEDLFPWEAWGENL